jgi:hypothetical protein
MTDYRSITGISRVVLPADMAHGVLFFNRSV